MDEDLVFVDRKEYEKLVERSRMIEALRAAGVTDWEGMPLAMEIYTTFND